MAKFSEILQETKTTDESASVTVYERVLIGLFGLTIAVLFVALGEGADKYFAIIFLLFPVFPAALGLAADFKNARQRLLERNRA